MREINNYSIPLTIRCDAEILLKVKAIAKKSRRSMNSQIVEFLDNCVFEYEQANGEVDTSEYD